MWNLALCVVLLQIERRWKLRPGRLFAFYLAGYFAGRFWIEGLRIDPAHVIGPLRLNQWVSVAVVVGAAGYLLADRRRSSVKGADPTQEPAGTRDEIAR